MPNDPLLHELSERWAGAEAAELANFQSYLIELCEALGVPRPGRNRDEFRPALAGLERFVATVGTSKHRFFTFLNGSTAPDNMLVCVASCPPGCMWRGHWPRVDDLVWGTILVTTRRVASTRSPSQRLRQR